jgi:hypothetical protein
VAFGVDELPALPVELCPAEPLDDEPPLPVCASQTFEHASSPLHVALWAHAMHALEAVAQPARHVLVSAPHEASLAQTSVQLPLPPVVVLVPPPGVTRPG